VPLRGRVLWLRPLRDGLQLGVFDSPSWLSENGRPSMAGPLRAWSSRSPSPSHGAPAA